MKARILFAGLLVVVLLSGLILPAVAEGPSPEEQLKLGQITEKEYDQLAPQGPGCGPEAAWPGPDGYGYVGAEVAFDWVDITATGTLIEGLTDDGYLTGFPIGFTFPFYGTDYTTFDVANNGFMGFGLTSGSLTNQCPLPNSSTPNNVISLLWDDLYPNYTSGGVYYEPFGTCPVGGGIACLVVEYYNWNHYSGAEGSAGTWEAILYEDGAVVLQFLDSGVETGLSSTTGIENNDAAADFGLTYACNVEFSIPDELAILFAVLDIPNLGDSTKTAPPKVLVGEPIEYTIEILNTGSAPALDAGLTDPIPPGTSYVPDSLYCSSGVCTYENGVVHWNGQVAPPPKGPASVRQGIPQPGQPAMGLTASAAGGSPSTSAHPEAVLWEQTTSEIQGGVSIDYPPEGWGAFSADDFQNAEPWSIETIHVPGWEYFGSMYNATAFHWCIYPDAGGVPAGHPYEGGEFWCNSASPYDPAVTIGGNYGGDVTVDVVAAWGGPLEVPPGTWWLVFYPEFTNSGTDWYYWWFADSANLANAHLVDPMDYFGAGLTTWTPWAELGITYWDLAFRLEGTAGGQMENPVTVTFAVIPEVCGETVVNVATIDDPELLEPVVVEASTEVWEMILLHEDFEGVFPPPGWVEAHDPAGMAWTDEDLEPRGNLTGGSGKFAIVDDDYGGSVALTEAELWTPPIDIPFGYETTLVYKTDYNNISANESADVDISLDGGATWINLQHWNADYRGPLTVQIDLTPFAPATGAILRFYYDDGDAYAWWWEIDDVQVVGCALPEEPDIRVEPGSLYAEQCPDEVTEQTLQICNDGILPLEWSLTEVPPPLAGGSVEIAPLAGVNSTTAPEGYLPTLTRSESQGRYPEAGTVCVFKNANAWGSTSVENILAANGIPYEVHTSAEFASLDFDLYGMIVFSSDQDQTFYDDYAANAAKFEAYVNNGGFLNFFAADQGWNGGSLTAPLPGGMTYSFYGENYNYVDDPAHPTMAGVPNPFYGSWGSHGVFANLPVDAHVITHGEVSGAPTTVEYPIGAGWFIGLAETLEISYDYGWEGAPILPNTLLWGYNWGPGVDIPWLSEEPTGGMVDPGTCQDVTVSFDSTGLAPSDYFGDLDIESNDPDEPQVMVPVQMTVLDCTEPDIEVTPESLYAEQCPDAMTAQPLNICNLGDADLTWSLSELVPPKGTQAVLYDNGPLVTHPGGGYGGADASVLQTNLSMNTYGVGHQYYYNYRIADDFVADADWTVDQITFFAYQTGSPTDPSTFLAYNLAVWDGLPGGGGSIIWGNYVDNCMVDTGWMGAYRVADYDMMGSTRPIMANVCETPGLVLPPGQYWLDWQADGSLSSGPWAPPITILGETTTGDGLQSLDGGATWAYVTDSGTLTQQGFPFIIEGTAGPPPDIPWLSEDPTGGMVPPGECQEVTVTFDSTGLAPGDYFGDLLINSNDPDEPAVTVPVQLTVLPCGNTMHVEDITGWFDYPFLQMRVLVADQDGMHLGNVFVEATITMPSVEWGRWRYTHPNGWARFWAPTLLNGNYEICVDNLVLAGYTYNPDDNVWTCMDWDY